MVGFKYDNAKNFDHQQLFDILSSIKGRFLLSYDDCPMARELYKDYKIESVIGKGTFATVRRGKNRCTGEKVAIKILSKEKMAPDDVAGL